MLLFSHAGGDSDMKIIPLMILLTTITILFILFCSYQNTEQLSCDR